MNSFLKLIASIIKQADELTSTHSSFRIVDSTAIGENPVRELSLDVVPLGDDSNDSNESIVTLAWKDSAEKILEKKTSSEEASHLSQLLQTDLAQLVKLTDENKYDEAKETLKNMLKTYAQDTSTPVETNLPKLNTTQAELDIDSNLWKQAAQVKMQNVFPSGTIQNLTFESTSDLKEYTDSMKAAQPGKEVPLWEQEGKAPESKDALVPSSLSYEDVEKQKEEEHENMKDHIDETIKKELESALQEKAASVFGPEQVELVKVLRDNGRNWDEIKKMLTKDFHFDKDAVVIFVDQQRQAAGDEGVEIKKEEPSPLKPPDNLVSPETHDKLLEDLKKGKDKIVMDDQMVENLDNSPRVDEPIVEESAQKSICPECDGEGDVPAVRGGHVTAIPCPSCSGDRHIEHAPKELESTIEEISRADNTDIRKIAADTHEHTCSKCDKVWECHKGQACNEGKSALCGKHYSEEEFGKKESSLKVATNVPIAVVQKIKEEIAPSFYRMNAPGAKFYRFSVEGNKIYRGDYNWEEDFGPYQFIYNMDTGMFKENPNYKPTAYASLKRAASYMRIPETDSIVKVALELWKYPSNYMGDDLSDYYKGPAKGYDADALDKSNFKIALEMLGGEGNGVLVGSFGGFGGRHEQIFVHKDAADKVAILQDIENKMSGYPVLDDSDYSEAQMEEERESYESWAKAEALKIIDQELHRQNPDLQGSVSELELTPDVEHILASVVFEDLSYGDGTALNPKHLLQEAEEAGLLNSLRNQLSGKEVVPENPAQMKLFESSLRSKIIKNALKKHAADDLNPLQEPIKEEPTMETPEQDIIPFGQAQHRAPKPASWVVVQSDLKGELPAFRGKFVSEETESDGTKWGIVDKDGELLKVEMHRITPETEGAQTSDPIAEPQIEKPIEEPIKATPSLDSLHSASSLHKKAYGEQLLNAPEDIQWLQETHLKDMPQYHGKFQSFIITGNEDAPDSLVLYQNREPLITDKPIAEITPSQHPLTDIMKELHPDAIDLPLSESDPKDFIGIPKEKESSFKRAKVVKCICGDRKDQHKDGTGMCNACKCPQWALDKDPEVRTLKQADEASDERKYEIGMNLLDKKLMRGDIHQEEYDVLVEKMRKEIFPNEAPYKELLGIKAEAEQLLKDVEGMGKKSYLFIKKGLEKHADDSAFEGNGWTRVWVQEDEIATDAAYPKALKLPDENARIAALKEIGLKLAHEALRLADSAGAKVGVQSWFESLKPSDHDRIDWVALANPQVEAESSLKQSSDFEKGISQNKTADEPAVEPKVKYKELKKAPAYTDREKAIPASQELDAVLAKMDALEQNLATLDNAKKQIQAKMKEEIAKLEQSAERVQMEKELQESINKSAVLIDALENKVVSWRDQVFTLQTQEVSYVPNVTPSEMLQKIYQKFEGAQKFVEAVLSGMKSQAVNVLEKTLVKFPGKKSSLNKEANVIDQWNDELLAALKELSSPL